MHGVGTPYAKRSFEVFGLKPFIPVKEQVEPDPDFPTVAFPNPEEGKGALVCEWLLTVCRIHEESYTDVYVIGISYEVCRRK